MTSNDPSISLWVGVMVEFRFGENEKVAFFLFSWPIGWWTVESKTQRRSNIER